MTAWSSLFSPKLAFGAVAACSVGTAAAVHLGAEVWALSLLAMTITSAAVGWLEASNRARETARLTASLESAARGVLNGRICRINPAYKDLARAQGAFNRLMDVFEAFAREAGAAMQHASRGAYYRGIRPEGLVGDFRPYVAAVNDGLDAMARTSETFRANASQISDRIRRVSGEITESADHLDRHGRAMQAQASRSAELCGIGLDAAEDGARRGSSIADTTGELHSVIGEIAKEAAAAASSAEQSTNRLGATRETLNDLSQVAERIGSVVGAITQIAEQTSLLALNATIESARAGESGRGFAVVAQEVKALALQAGEQTGQIASQVEAIQSRVRHTVSGIETVHQDLAETRGRAAAIAAAVEQQSAAVGEIASDVTTVSQEVDRAAGSARDAAAEAESTKQASDQMLEIVARVRSTVGELEADVTRFLAAVE